MKKIAIVGTAPTSVKEAPYDDNSWLIWSLGSNFASIPRFNRWFELHNPRALKVSQELHPKRLEFLQKINKDLYVGFTDAIWPEATIYPKDEIVKQFGNYFTSSIAWMIALAIHEGAEEIGLWGIDMVGDHEYAKQRACCEYLLGVAVGKGIKITIAPTSPLLRCERMYAFEYSQFSGEVHAKSLEIKKQLETMDADYLRLLADRSFARGMLYQIEDMWRRWA